VTLVTRESATPADDAVQDLQTTGLSENRMFNRLAVSIVATLATSIFAAPTFAQHIVVVRDVLLEAAHPNLIAPAPDGGYVIAGYADHSAWATKVNESGKVIWRHELAGSTVSPGGGGTEYRGITFLRDGTMLLCGSLDVSVPTPAGRGLPIVPRSGLQEPIKTIPEVDTSDPALTYPNRNKTPAAKGESAEFQRRAAYALPDGSLALFGATFDYGGTAAVEWLSADGTKHETHVFTPSHGAGQIDAVAPTPRPDEFATARLIIPGLRHTVGPDETRSAVMLTFLRFQ
jgi:hypothetical protein